MGNSDISCSSVGGNANSILLLLDSDNIAEIQIINGPAGASMYGTNGSNGVVLITTKSGISIN